MVPIIIPITIEVVIFVLITSLIDYLKEKLLILKHFYNDLYHTRLLFSRIKVIE